MHVGVFGAGYVGLVTGTCFAEMGNEVICCDVDAERVARLRSGEVPIYEPGLEELLRKNIEEGRLSFTTDAGETVRRSEVLFIAVGTPADEDGSADLSRVLEVARTIGRHADSPKVVVNKSTVPVGTADEVRAVLAETSEHRHTVVSNPEFLKEGTAVDDFMRPDRIVVGADDAESAEVVKSLFAPFVRTGNPILVMDTRSAEMTKYASNAMLATRITFMNEIANLCERVGADVDKVRAGVGTDRRIGPSFLFPGVGFGGSCFPKDVRALERLADEVEYGFALIRAVHEVNEYQKRLLAGKIRAHFGNQLDGLGFAVWGLAFKPRTDDVREAPALALIEDLLESGARVAAFDPKAMENTRRVFGPRIEYAVDAYSALEDADALVIVTEWNEFRFPDFARIKAALRRPVIFDGRNVYDPKLMAADGFIYYSVGRPASTAPVPAEAP
ncbi:MAG TPA: UDP-glucose/GDP-mannose dehydrogenase family protein [Gemmatimonadota bacterium]|nr:UDP-glucose/GDP-mannose dehydrogenase family protein [Gemmatimonadota bacterium]